MFKRAVKIFLNAWLRIISILVLFRVFVLVFGTLFSETDDFYSYHLLGEQPLDFWIFLVIISVIFSFIEAYIEKRKNNK